MRLLSDPVGSRFRMVRRHFGLPSAAAMATRVGLSSPRTWYDYERGKRLPTGPVFALLAEMGVDLNWLLTGQGQMLGGASAPSTAAAIVDKGLMGRIFTRIKAVYAEEGQKIADIVAVGMAAEWYNELAAASADPADRLEALGAKAAGLRAELRTAAIDPASTKRLA